MPMREGPGETSLFAWVLLSIIAGFLVYGAVALVLHSVWTAFGLGVLALVIAVPTAITMRKFRRLRESRQRQDIGAFARSIRIREMDTWVVRATYEEVAAYVGSDEEPFPVHASDRLKEDLEIDGDDLWDVISAIAKRCGRSSDDFDRNPLYPKMKTVEDLIRVLMLQDRAEGAEPEHSRDGLPARA